MFSVYDNQLSGSVPASAAKWKAMKQFELNINHFSPTVLPALDFVKMTHCNLLDPSDGGSNAFHCPWPQGATAKCYKWKGSKNVAITDSDCVGPLRCNAATGACEYDANGQLNMTQCSATCLAPNGCGGASTKLPAAQCAAWVKFYDGTNGDGWTGDAASCTRHDPCGCKGNNGNNPVCNSANTAVTTMCVCLPLPPRLLSSHHLPLLSFHLNSSSSISTMLLFPSLYFCFSLPPLPRAIRPFLLLLSLHCSLSPLSPTRPYLPVLCRAPLAPAQQ